MHLFKTMSENEDFSSSFVLPCHLMIVPELEISKKKLSNSQKRTQQTVEFSTETKKCQMLKLRLQ